MQIQLSLEIVIFILLLIDSIGANAFTWLGGDKWYKKHFRIVSRYVPASKAWTSWYFILVLWIGVMLIRSGHITF